MLDKIFKKKSKAPEIIDPTHIKLALVEAKSYLLPGMLVVVWSG